MLRYRRANVDIERGSRSDATGPVRRFELPDGRNHGLVDGRIDRRDRIGRSFRLALVSRVWCYVI